MAKNQTKPKEHPETELLLPENYSLSSSTLSSKIIGDNTKKEIPLFKWSYMINDNEEGLDMDK